jgi:hypothetical protein
VATHLFQLAQNNFLAILEIYYFSSFNFRGHFEGLNEGFLRSIFSMIDEEVVFGINDLRHGCMGQKVFQGLKSFFTFLCPREFSSLLLEGSDWTTNLGESFYKSPIVSC